MLLLVGKLVLSGMRARVDAGHGEARIHGLRNVIFTTTARPCLRRFRDTGENPDVGLQAPLEQKWPISVFFSQFC